jgi:hypothetical protein
VTTDDQLVVRGASDLHGQFPEVEPCDVLLLAGDLVPLDVQNDVDLSRRWFSSTFAKWLDDIPAREIVGIAGNHDVVLERVAGRGVHPWLFDANWTYLHDALTTLDCGLSVYGTPWSPGTGDWSFSAKDVALAETFENIPAGLDVLMTHTPPYGKGDMAPRAFQPFPGRYEATESIGSRALDEAITRAAPRLVVYGHVHRCGGWRGEIDGTRFANVSVLDQKYKLVRPASEPLLGPS